MTVNKKVCVIGGGFGGLYTALKIGRKMDDATEVYLIEPKERFVFLPLLYELAVGTASATEVAPRYKSLLSNTKVKLIRASVNSINFEDKVCKLKVPCSSHSKHSDSEKSDSVVTEDIPKSISFDQLVIAVGVQPRMDLIPGAKEYALPFYRINDAFTLKKKLKELRELSSDLVRVTVIGGGYSGVEVATNVALDLGIEKASVTIVDRNLKIMQTSPDHNRNIAEKALMKNGINIYYNTSVNAVRSDGVDLTNEASQEKFFLPSDLVIFTAGTEQSDFIKGLDINKDTYGRIQTSSTLQSTTYPNVYAIGDCASIDSQLVPSTAQAAMQQSETAGSNVLRMIKKERMESKNNKRNPPALKEFKFVSLGEMLTLGDTNAAVTTLGGYVKLRGPLAALSRRAVYTIRQPTVTQTVKSVISASAVTTGKLIRKRFTRRNSATK